MPDQGWEDIIRLAEVFSEDFGGLVDDVERNGRKWQEVWLQDFLLKSYVCVCEHHNLDAELIKEKAEFCPEYSIYVISSATC